MVLREGVRVYEGVLMEDVPPPLPTAVSARKSSSTAFTAVGCFGGLSSTVSFSRMRVLGGSSSSTNGR